MILTSAAYKTALKKSAIDDKITGNIYIGETVKAITDRDIFDGSLYINRSIVSGDAVEIGSANVSELGISINATEEPETYYGAKIILMYQLETSNGTFESVPLGTFFVDEAERRDGGGLILTAYDRMFAFDIPLQSMASGTPAAWISSICTQSGVVLGTPAQEIIAMPNGSVMLSLTAESPVKTCRDALMWICQTLGANAVMAANDTLRIVPMKYTEPDYDIGSRQVYSEKHSDNTLKITGISYNDDEVLSGSDHTILGMEANPFWASKERADVQGYIDTILAVLTNAEYTPATIEYVGDPAIECGDYIYVIVDGAAIKMLVTSTKWRYGNAQTLESAGRSITQRKNYNQTQKSVSAIADVLELTKQIVEATKTSADLINNAIGGNVLIRQTPGETNEILIMDSPDPAQAIKIWRWNMGGLGYSDNVTGADNPLRTYSVAITMNGAISADFVSTGILRAILIQAVEINCNDKFTVSPSGVVTAVSGTIGGWNLSPEGFTSKGGDGEAKLIYTLSNATIDSGENRVIYSETQTLYIYEIDVNRAYIINAAGIDGTLVCYSREMPLLDVMMQSPYYYIFSDGMQIADTNQYSYISFALNSPKTIIFTPAPNTKDKVGVISGNVGRGYSGVYERRRQSDDTLTAKELVPYGGSDVRFYSGSLGEPDTYTKLVDAPFYVTESGFLKAVVAAINSLISKNENGDFISIHNGEIVSSTESGNISLRISKDGIKAQYYRGVDEEVYHFDLDFPLKTVYTPSVPGRGNKPVTVFPLVYGDNGKVFYDESQPLSRYTD